MSCARGLAVPDSQTKMQLFADSGGYCQNPECLGSLFIDVDQNRILIAEIAHICAAADKGPRSNPTLTRAMRGAYANLILLCPTCHTIVDKAPHLFPDERMLAWKNSHKERIDDQFGILEYTTRNLVRTKIEPLLRQNLAIFNSCGPLGEHVENPESSLALVWKKKIVEQILPNNRMILAVLDKNQRHLNDKELLVLERYRQHVLDLEDKHLGGSVDTASTRFPPEMNRMAEN